jgi:hypothetical protein
MLVLDSKQNDRAAVRKKSREWMMVSLVKRDVVGTNQNKITRLTADSNAVIRFKRDEHREAKYSRGS